MIKVERGSPHCIEYSVEGEARCCNVESLTSVLHRDAAFRGYPSYAVADAVLKGKLTCCTRDSSVEKGTSVLP